MKIMWNKFLKDEAGNMGIFGAIGASTVLAASALAIESNSLYGQYGSFQSALDAATLAAASVDPDQYDTVATEIFDLSLGIDSIENKNVTITRQGDILIGTASGSINALFGGVLTPATIDISAATKVGFSREVGGQDPEEVGKRACIIVLSDQNESLRLNSNSHIVAPECEVHVHSTQQRSVVADSSQHDVSKFCLSANQLNNNNSGLEVDLNCDVAADPFAGQVPTNIPNNCVSQPQNLNGNSPQVFTEGRYCQGLNVNGQADIHFEPGTYYITGNWNVNGGKWTGDDVTFVFGQNGNIQFNSNFGGMDMSAPTSGDFANLFMVDLNGQNQFILNSGNELNISGSIYMPKRQVTYNSASTTNGSEMNFVVDKLTINSQASLNLIPTVNSPEVPGEDYEGSGNGEGTSDGDGSDKMRVASSDGTPYLLR